MWIDAALERWARENTTELLSEVDVLRIGGARAGGRGRASLHGV
jgi:hypothetical protein